VVGIKYDLLDESSSDNSASTHRTSTDTPLKKKAPAKKATKPIKASQAEPAPRKVSKKEPRKEPPKVVPFQRKEKEEHQDDDSEIRAIVRQAMHALEKGNSVAGYNLLKKIIPDS
jgi:outer membrane biosynthesis protein TonB